MITDNQGTVGAYLGEPAFNSPCKPVLVAPGRNSQAYHGEPVFNSLYELVLYQAIFYFSFKRHYYDYHRSLEKLICIVDPKI